MRVAAGATPFLEMSKKREKHSSAYCSFLLFRPAAAAAKRVLVGVPPYFSSPASRIKKSSMQSNFNSSPSSSSTYFDGPLLFLDHCATRQSEINKKKALNLSHSCVCISHSDAADGSNRPCTYLLPGADVVVQYMACLQLLLLDLNLLLLAKKSWSPRL